MQVDHGSGTWSTSTIPTWATRGRSGSIRRWKECGDGVKRQEGFDHSEEVALFARSLAVFQRKTARFCFAGALAGAGFLVTQTSFAFRSAGNLAEFDGQKRVAFASPTIALELFSELPPNVSLAGVEANVKQATTTWRAPGCTDVAISYVGTTQAAATPGDGHNTIQWVSNWKERGFPKTSPGLTDVQYEKDANGHWTITEADTYLDLDYGWTTSIPLDDSKSIAAVLTHEFGHALGLFHPCELDGSGGAPKCSNSAELAIEEMYPVYSPDQTTLSDDDIRGVCFLYSPACDDTSCVDGEKCVAGTCKPLCGDSVCGTAEKCEGAHCVATSKDCGPTGCVGQACAANADCSAKEFCNGHVCARGENALGDVCSAASECFDGACSAGACAESCASGGQCQSGGACDVSTNTCTDALSPMGAACSYATDCRGGYCLAESGHAPVCTRSCDKRQPTCPADWICRTADAQLVCAPQELRTSAGCSISSSGRAPHFPSYPSGIALGSLSILYFRKSRRRQLRRSLQ